MIAISLKDSYNNPKFSDIQIICNNHKIFVHRVVIGYIGYFKGLLNFNPHQSIINIEEDKIDYVIEMLKYYYNALSFDYLSNYDTNTLAHLYIIADEYQAVHLRSAIATYLRNKFRDYRSHIDEIKETFQILENHEHLIMKLVDILDCNLEYRES